MRTYARETGHESLANKSFHASVAQEFCESLGAHTFCAPPRPRCAALGFSWVGVGVGWVGGWLVVRG